MIILGLIVAGSLRLGFLGLPGGVGIQIRQQKTLVRPDPLYDAITSGGSIASIKQMLNSDRRMLNSRVLGATPLYWAAQAKREDLVGFLLDQGADPNIACTDGGETPVVPAVENCELEALKELIAKGADLGAHDVTGRTLMECAQDSNWQEGIVLLAKATKGAAKT